MNILKRALALVLTLTILLLTACAPVVPPPECDGNHADEDGDLFCDVCGENLEEPFPDDFLPVLRFAITSDVHVRAANNDMGSEAKLRNFITSAYTYADSYTPYTALDGIFIVGDLTQDGKLKEYDKTKLVFRDLVRDETTLRVTMGNHEMHDFGFTLENIALATERFKTELGYESEDWHAVINGYHFISVANDTYETRNYFNEETLAWLKGEIEAAMADDPSGTKPIFVMNHQPPKSDVRGFTNGDTELGELLKDYPLVVDFSGHTHRSILDPQSIWQDGFTAIGTGGLAYLGYNMAGHPTLNNSSVVSIDEYGAYGSGNVHTRTGAMYYIVEIDKDSNIRLKVYDLLTESFYGEPIIFKVGADEPEVFTADREAESVAPIFPENAKIEAISTDFNLPEIKFTTPTGGDLTSYYRIEITKESDTEPALVFYRLGLMHLAANPPEYATAPIRWLTESGAYTVEIYAVNCWGKESEPLTATLVVDEKTMTPDILNVVWHEDGSATNGDTTLRGYGDPTVTYDEELGRYIASFNGRTGYRFTGLKDYNERIKHALTIETYFRAGESESNYSIGANNNSAGFGLHRLADGTVRFTIRFNNGASRYLTVETAPGTAPVGEWVHVVMVYDSDNIIIYVNGEAATLYVDGEEIGTAVNCSGRLYEPTSGLAGDLIVGGDISSIGGIESYFIGDIATYNLYSRPLNESEVKELYKEYNPN